MEIKYYQKGDYFFPNLELKEESVTIGKYGMLRKAFLKDYKKGLYQSMLLTGKLGSHLQEIEKVANERLEILMEGLLQNYPAPDKKSDHLAWAAHMNMLTNMAEENVLEEVVYG